jgi:EmrB/QacA subfamily drug resistance transporter
MSSMTEERYESSGEKKHLLSVNQDAGAEELTIKDSMSPLQWNMVLLSLLLAVLLAALDSTVVAAATPSIVQDLQGSQYISWIVSAYLISSTATVPLYGKFSDVFGRRGMFLLGQLIFLAGSVACGFAQTMIQLIAFRAVQGVGAGGVLGVVPIILGDCVTPRERGRYAGVFGAVYAIASVAGPLVGGLCTDYMSWRWAFFLNVPVAVPCAILTVLFVRIPIDVRLAKKKIDVAGAILVAACATSALLALTLVGPDYTWTSPLILGLAGGALLTMILFLVNVNLVQTPIIAIHIFRNFTVCVAVIIASSVGVGLFCGITFIPVFLHVIQNYSATMSGAYLLPMLSSFVISSIIAGMIVAKTGKYALLPVLGMAFCCTGFFLLTRIREDTPYYAVGLPAIACGIGIGLCFQIVLVVVQNEVQIEDMASATAVVTFFRSLAGALGVAVFQTLMQLVLDRKGISNGLDAINDLDSKSSEEQTRIRTAFAEAMAEGFYWVGAASALGLLLSFCLRNKALRSTTMKLDVGE